MLADFGPRPSGPSLPPELSKLVSVKKLAMGGVQVCSSEQFFADFSTNPANALRSSLSSPPAPRTIF